MKKRYKFIQLGLGILFTYIGLKIFLKNVDGHRLLQELTSYGPLPFVGCTFCAFVSIYLRTIRWKLLIPQTAARHYKGLFAITAIGFAVNNVFPARIGEAVRALLLWKRNGVSVTVSIGSLIVERAIDTVALISFFFVPVFLMPMLHNQTIPVSIGSFHTSVSLLSFAKIALIPFCACVLFLILYRYFPSAIRQWATNAVILVPVQWRPKIRAIGTELFSTVSWVFSFKKVVAIIIFSIIIEWTFALFFNFLLLPLTQSGILGGLFAQAFGALGAAIPLAPGYIGTMHATVFQGLSFLGIDAEKARAVTILYHGVAYVVLTAMGAIFLFTSHISLKEITHAKDNLTQ